MYSTCVSRIRFGGGYENRLHRNFTLPCLLAILTKGLGPEEYNMAVLGRTHFPDKSSTSMHMCIRVIANATENRDCKRMFSFQFHRLREEKERAERAYEELEERFRPYRVSVHVILCLHVHVVITLDLTRCSIT